MKRTSLLLLALITTISVWSQKKPLDHAVYDSWKAVGERTISQDGRYLAYAINPQEGDGVLVIQSSDNSWKKEIPRGYNATITEDNKYVIFRIRAFFKETREARIKKKRPDDMPKDSLGIIELGKDSVTRIGRVKSYKLPEKNSGQWLAYHMEKALPEPPKPRTQPDSVTQLNNLSRMADSLVRVADSLRNKANEARTKGLIVLQAPKKETRPAAKPAEDPVEEGTELVFRNLYTGEERRFKLVNEYYFNKFGNILVIETSRKSGDTLSTASLLWMNIGNSKVDTVMKKFNDAKSYGMDETGSQLVFVAERDSVAKALVKFYKLWYYKPGMDSARLRVDRNTAGVPKGFTVSPDFFPNFSKDGSKLFIGLTPIRKPKDTTLVDFETARLDVWHYNDDYLQPQQLLQSPQELRRSYAAVLNEGSDKVIPLGSDEVENIFLANEGNANHVLATTSRGARVEMQWQGFIKQSAYLISTVDGSKKTIAEKKRSFYSLSPKGNYVIWYDPAVKNYFTYNVASGVVTNITKGIKTPLYDEEDDHPDDPPAHGTGGWTEDDKGVLVYDRYDIWAVDPDGKLAPVNLTQSIGRTTKTELRYQRMDPEERFIRRGQTLLLRGFNEKTKYAGVYTLKLEKDEKPVMVTMLPNTIQVQKARKADKYLVQKADVSESELFVSDDLKQLNKITDVAKQQQDYNWLTVELVKWKMFDGKESEGLLFKPENFDPKKKYPVIFYFYERNADGLYAYRTPAPSASTVNIAYFVSNGYLVFDPNIYYKDGDPGESAYNSVVSAAKYLGKMPWVDSTKMAIQGQSWGGYQVAYLVTRTKMFAAAGAGAPVSNMTSAYGGIRWGSGLNRQFQYERSQSRIGATLWERRDLYIKNSPLFHADKVSTPILIMHNDKDGAVPWYQGIEYFTALRRLGKKVWMLQYNDEDHNLVERRNRKDLSIRLSQFFDHYLKGAPAAKWIRDGVPAIAKGIEWGTEVEEKKAF